MSQQYDRLQDAGMTILEAIDPKPCRQGLFETPHRFASAWRYMMNGYDEDPSRILKCFEDGAEKCDEMVIRKNIPVRSFCEHHLLPVFGVATVAYIPNGKVVGLSKLDRLVDMYARRLQVQERMTNQIADALDTHLNPLGVGVWVNARHLCIEYRGVQNASSETVTVALRGNIKILPEARAEFLAAARA